MKPKMTGNTFVAILNIEIGFAQWLTTKIFIHF